MIRIATAVLSKRIFAGHPLKSGLGFREPRHDVTNDVYEAIKDHVGIGHQIELRRDGEPGFIIRILPLPAESGDGSGAHDASAKGQQGLAPNPPPIKPEGKDASSGADIARTGPVARPETSAAEVGKCDCEAPEPTEGVALVSEACPIHGGTRECWS